MNDEQILERGGTEGDIKEYARQNGADLTKADVEVDTLHRVRAKVIEAVPEIMELKFGCELIQQGIHFVCVGTMPGGEPITVKKEGAFDASKPEGANLDVFQGKTEIIGRPITLEDVLRAMSSGIEIQMLDAEEGMMVQIGYDDRADENSYTKWASWDLGKPLDEQSAETVEFIGKVLGV